ncbi:MAG: DEAD/DEAH box helicase [Candidatus Heimdallarchaeota archaeon]
MSTVAFSFRGDDLVVYDDTIFNLLLPKWKEQAILDTRLHAVRLPPRLFPEVREFLEKQGRVVETRFSTDFSLSGSVQINFEPRAYQQEALQKWFLTGNRGVIVAPTASGKSFIGAMAINLTQMKTLILVPTLNLLEQWEQFLRQHLLIEQPTELIGQFGGGRKEIRDITIITYDSAHLYVRRLRDHFGLLIADECHHLVAASYRLIADGSIAPFRLGLTATPERADELHHDLAFLIGSEIVRITPQELEDKGFIAPFKVERVPVFLDAEEKRRYEKARNIYQKYLKTRNIRFRSIKDFEQKLVFWSGRDPKAREALLAHHEARKIAFNARRKIEKVGELLAQHKTTQILIFTEFTRIAEEIGRRFLIPVITHRTKLVERKEILQKFTHGEISKLCTGRVLDEGLDVAGASVGIVVSGSAQARQAIQRLGRLLRPKAGKEAILYEIISERTIEETVSQRRGI